MRHEHNSLFRRRSAHSSTLPHAWIDTSRRDPQDGEIGIVGYEINFNRYFYEYRPPRPPEEIEADIQKVEKEIVPC